MNIPDNYLKLIVDEFKEVEKLCNEAVAPEDKLYFFSATYGIINRVMNLHYDSILIFSHQILQAVHQTLSQRLSTATPNGPISTSVPTVMINSLTAYLPELTSAFEDKDDNKIRAMLEKYNTLSYATGGNGFYLLLRGKLKL